MRNITKYKFRGGVWMGLWANSWPFGSLKIDEEEIILRDDMIGKRFEFQKDEIDKIVPKRIFPIIGCGIRIYPKKKNVKLCFWVGGKAKLNQLTSALKTLNYPLIK